MSTLDRFVPEICTAADLMSEPPPPRRVRRVRGGLLLDGDYFIAWNRIKTPLELVHWIAHLTGKTWVDNVLIEQLIEACDRHHKLGVWEVNP